MPNTCQQYLVLTTQMCQGCTAWEGSQSTGTQEAMLTAHDLPAVMHAAPLRVPKARQTSRVSGVLR